MVGVIIVNYKTNIETINFIKSELSKIRLQSKIVIVNNEVGPDDIELYSENLNAEFVLGNDKRLNKEGDIFLINSAVNLGFAKGNNLGAEFLISNFKPDYLLFTNNDLIIKDEDVVEKLIRKMETLPSVALIGPKMIDLSGKLISPRYDRISPWRFILHYLFYPVYSTNIFTKLGLHTKGKIEIEKRELDESYCYWVAGSFMLVRVNDFIEINGFDPNTFLYCEEKILAEKFMKINKKAYYFAEPLIISIGGLTTSKYLRNKERDKLIFKSEIYYYKQYRNISVFTHIIMLITRYIYFSFFYQD
jgi:GT2 family glycosyltransferase